MKLGISLFVLILLRVTYQSPFFTAYECVEKQCRRIARPIGVLDFGGSNRHSTLAACRLVCDDNAALWPLPTGHTLLAKNYVQVDPSGFQFNLDSVPVNLKLLVSAAIDRFMLHLDTICLFNCTKTFTSVLIKISIDSSDTDIDWNTKEDYTLDVSTERDGNVMAQVTSSTFFGARHALETLSQLVAPIRALNGELGLAILESATIKDAPTFPHRGLLIDTARNFLTVEDILRTIDGLATVKMNVLHWHATDSQSFPLDLKNIPLMARYGAYSADRVYTIEDTRRIISYAKTRGVRVILELDSPSHVGAGWEWGESYGLGNLTVCANQQPWRDYCIQPPCGQLNPVNPNTFKVLSDIYSDVLDILGTNSVLHLGGDEVFINCWNSSSEITTEMIKRGMGRQMSDFLKLWGDFHKEQLRVLDNVKGSNTGNVILWSSQLTSPDVVKQYLDESRYIIQTWVESDSDLPNKLLQLGYRLIVSTKNAWYLDHGFWGNTKYHSWKDAYNNRIPNTNTVLGGEVCMWGEYVNGGSLDSRVWPRTAAVAERLWSDPYQAQINIVESRLQAHRERLQVKQIRPEAITPEWCVQHERQCS